jgi:hypothetical protein
MTHEGAPAVFVIHEVAPVRAAIQGARDAPTGSIIGLILYDQRCSVRSDHAKKGSLIML